MNEYYSSRRIENRNKYKLFFTFYESNRNESVLTIYLEFHRSNNSGFSKYFSRCRCCKINGCWRLVPGFQMDKQYSKERKSPGLLESTARPPLPPLRDHFLSIQRPRTAGQAGSREQRKVALKSSIATTSPIVIPRHRPHTSHASVRKGNSEASIFLTDFFNYDVKPKEAERRTSILSRKTDRAAKEMLNIDDVSSGSDSSHGSERPRSKGELGHSESSSDESIKHGTHTRFESDSLGSNSSNSNSDSLNSDSSDSSGGSSSDSEEDTGGRAQSVVRRIPGDQQFKFFASGYNEEEDGYSSSGRSSSDDSEVIINKLGLSITRDFTEQVLTHREQYSNTDQGNESSDDDSDQDNEGQRDDSSSDKEDGGSEPGRSKHLGSDSSSSGSSEETEDTEEGEIEAEHCGMGSSMKAWKTPPRKESRNTAASQQNVLREKLIIPKLPVTEQVLVEDVSAQDLQYLEAFTTPRSTRLPQYQDRTGRPTEGDESRRKHHVPPHIRLSQKEESLHMTVNNAVEKKSHSKLPRFSTMSNKKQSSIAEGPQSNGSTIEQHPRAIPMPRVRVNPKRDSPNLDKTYNFRAVRPNAIGSPEFQLRIVRAAEAAAEAAERKHDVGDGSRGLEGKKAQDADEENSSEVASREHMIQMLSALNERRQFLQSTEERKAAMKGVASLIIPKHGDMSSMAPSPSAILGSVSPSIQSDQKVPLNGHKFGFAKSEEETAHLRKQSKVAFLEVNAKDGHGATKPFLVSRKSNEFKRRPYTAPHKKKHPVEVTAEQAVRASSSVKLSESLTAKKAYGGRRLEYVRLLGRGASAKVYLGRLHRTSGASSKGELVAVKQLRTLNKKNSENDEIGRVLRLEVDTLRRLHHRNIVAYRGMHFSKRRKEYQILMEYVDGGSLADAVKKFPNGIAHDELVRIATQIVDGLMYLHAQKVIHRDLKPANILFSKKGVVKIADFDISTQVHGLIKTKQRSCVGTPWYTAPEVILVEPYSYSADIWSLGCTMYQLATGKCPYSECNAVQAMFKMVNCGCPDFPADSKLHADLRNFIFQCFQRDPKKRPSARTLREHQFLCGKWARFGCLTGAAEDENESDEDRYSSDFDDDEDMHTNSHK